MTDFECSASAPSGSESEAHAAGNRGVPVPVGGRFRLLLRISVLLPPASPARIGSSVTATVA